MNHFESLCFIADDENWQSKESMPDWKSDLMQLKAFGAAIFQKQNLRQTLRTKINNLWRHNSFNVFCPFLYPSLTCMHGVPKKLPTEFWKTRCFGPKMLKVALNGLYWPKQSNLDSPMKAEYLVSNLFSTFFGTPCELAQQIKHRQMLRILSWSVFKIFFAFTNDRPNQCPVNYASKRFSMIDGLSDVKEAEASTFKDVGK